jgi:hypothetical protein
MRLQLGANRKLIATRWIGKLTVGVRIGTLWKVPITREKASNGAEKSSSSSNLMKKKTHRGQRSVKKLRVRGGKPRRQNRSAHGGNHRNRKYQREERSELWMERCANKYIGYVLSVRERHDLDRVGKRNAMSKIRRSFIENSIHVSKIFGSSISWGTFLYLIYEPVWRANVDLRMSIRCVPFVTISGLVTVLDPERDESWREQGIDRPCAGTRFCRECGERVFLKGKRVVDRPHAEVCRAKKRETIRQDPNQTGSSPSVKKKVPSEQHRKAPRGMRGPPPRRTG